MLHVVLLDAFPSTQVQLVLGDAQQRAVTAFDQAALQSGRSHQPLDLTWTAAWLGGLESLIVT